MQLYYIRHGQSANNLLWERTRSSDGRNDDPELTDLGRQQAEHVARFLSQPIEEDPSAGRDVYEMTGGGLTHLYTSLMVRSVATAVAIAGAVGLPLVGWADLHEEGGIYQTNEQRERIGRPGKTRAYFLENYPSLVLPEEVTDAGWWNRPYEVEAERTARGQRVWQELIARHGNTHDRVGLVSHGGFYNRFMEAVLNFSLRRPEGGAWLHMRNTAVSRLDYANGWVDLVYQNRVDFLPRELVT